MSEFNRTNAVSDFKRFEEHYPPHLRLARAVKASFGDPASPSNLIRDAILGIWDSSSAELRETYVAIRRLMSDMSGNKGKWVAIVREPTTPEAPDTTDLVSRFRTEDQLELTLGKLADDGLVYNFSCVAVEPWERLTEPMIGTSAGVLLENVSVTNYDIVGSPTSRSFEDQCALPVIVMGSPICRATYVHERFVDRSQYVIGDKEVEKLLAQIEEFRGAAVPELA